MFLSFFILYLLIINVIGFLAMFIDKQKAIKGAYRIPERTLWSLAWCGGAFGCTLGMKLFHHKTQKGYFSIGFPLIALLYFEQILLIIIFTVS